jgi:teichoic acid transport system ATP-binding protein
MSDYAIQIKHVSKVYKLYNRPSDRLIDTFGLPGRRKFKEHPALKDVSFGVKKGETLGIIGTNGSGKSTILKIITGVLNPTEGEVEIDGRISALLELGAGFNMEYTGIQNVYLNGMMMGFSDEEIDAKLQDILDFADIGDFVNQPVKTYSSGMFVRLAFAVAINIEPEILIVDEALSVGDVFFQAKCYKKFEEFKEQGKTILFVSHDLGSIVKYCDRVVVLNKGDMLDEGEPKDMVALYKRVLLGQTRDAQEKLRQKLAKNEVAQDETLWKSHYILNKNVDEYGTGRAAIVDFAIIDENGVYTSCIEKGTRFQIRSKVHFFEQIHDPIFTYSFKNVQGTTITGTNTMYEHASPGTVEAGDEYVATFEQEMFLQGGEYLLSISCTGYDATGFTAYHRLYDVCTVTVISDKDTVGFYDMNSKVTLEKL